MYVSFYLIFTLVWWLKISTALTHWTAGPDDFVSKFLNCARDNDCHFYFWHIMKTGGTTLNLNMDKVFPLKTKKNLPGPKATMVLKENMEAYCLSKWSSYEATGEQMLMIVEKCMKFNRRSTAIIMVIYREPIARFVSIVNMYCNKRWEWRSAETQSFCSRCKYDPETKPFLQKYIDEANEIYLSASSITENNFTNVQVLSLDTIYLDGFLKSLRTQPGFKVISLAKKNIHKTDICDFGVTAGIIRELAPSLGVYRNLTIMSYVLT